MRPADEIENVVEKMSFKAGPEMDRDLWAGTLKATNEFHKTILAPTQQNIRRTIMKSRMTKLAAAAAVIIIAVLAGIHYFGGSTDLANIAWGEVIRRTAQVDNVHVYWLKSRGDVLFRQFEAWYAHGKLVMRGDKGGMSYDDARTRQSFDEQGRRTTKEPSFFAEGRTLFELFTAGLLSEKNEQFNEQTPINVGDDFLIYQFDPSGDDSEWIESIFITVGKNSLLPVQVKVYHKDGDYDLVMFDYEAPEKPPEFFEPPAVEPPNGTGEVVLDGEEVTIDIEGAPGIKQAIVRLHDKYDGPSDQFPLDYIRSNRLAPDFCRAVSERVRKDYEERGGPIFRIEVSFVTDEGYRSGTNDIIVSRLNEAGQCGVGSESGDLDDWPDGKYRNIRFSPLLKPTDREDIHTVEIRCWLKPKED
jgi:hypothetical protein